MPPLQLGNLMAVQALHSFSIVIVVRTHDTLHLRNISVPPFPEAGGHWHASRTRQASPRLSEHHNEIDAKLNSRRYERTPCVAYQKT
jgi:hypothetical protein